MKSKQQAPGEAMAVSAGEAPKMFKIGDATDNVKAFRVSKDAVIAAVVLGTDDIHIYRVRESQDDVFFEAL